MRRRIVIAAALPLVGCPATFVTVAPGGLHTCATSSERLGKCWGQDDVGQLGDGAAGGSRHQPAEVVGLGMVSGLAAGTEHACGIRENREVWCWGSNQYGQLGSGSSAASSATPQKVGWPPPTPPVIPPSQTTLTNVISVAAGDYHSCAALENGEVWCWGVDSNGELGSPQIRGNSDRPQLVTDLHIPNVGGPPRTLKVAAAGQFTCALLEGGEVWCWGLNTRGQMGRGTTSETETPAPVSGLSGVTAITVGHDQACALVGSSVRCWGQNLAGFSSTTPVAIANLPDAKGVAAGAMHACAILLDGSVRCWGSNYFGQLGTSSPSSSTTPIAVPGLTGGVRIAAGHYDTCMVQSSGALWCWGLDDQGQTGQPPPSPSVTAPPAQVLGL